MYLNFCKWVQVHTHSPIYAHIYVCRHRIKIPRGIVERQVTFTFFFMIFWVWIFFYNAHYFFYNQEEKTERPMATLQMLVYKTKPGYALNSNSASQNLCPEIIKDVYKLAIRVFITFHIVYQVFSFLKT